jgi:hypothetical protein
MTRNTALFGKRFASGKRRTAAIVLPALLAFLPLSTAASQAGSICHQIEHRLAAVSASPRQGPDRLARAVQLSRAAGCGARGFASPHDTHCRVHARRIRDLQSSGLAPTDPAREHGRLMAALRANGCQGREPEPRRVAKVERAAPAIRTVDGTIPVPLPRPMSPAEIYQTTYVQHGKSRLAAIDLARLEELARPRAIPASRRTVRVVGGRFLAQPDEETNFMAIATGSDNPANELLGGVLAVISEAIVSKAVAAEH